MIPQFLVTGLASLIFAIFEPERSVLEGHHAGTSHPVPPTNGTVADLGAELLRRADEAAPREFDSIGLIFRSVNIAIVRYFARLTLSRTTVSVGSAQR